MSPDGEDPPRKVRRYHAVAGVLVSLAGRARGVSAKGAASLKGAGVWLQFSMFRVGRCGRVCEMVGFI